jgi:hypothetical protein
MGWNMTKGKVIFATPSLTGPTAPYIEALEAAIPLIIEAGWEEGYAQEIGCPYISAARSKLTRRALDAGADVIVYLDYDLSFDPHNLLQLIETEGDVVAGTYRLKKGAESTGGSTDDEEEYMGTICTDADHRPITRADGCIKADRVPAGFLKVTKAGIQRFMRGYPELLFGDPDQYAVDLFNHGAFEGQWWGEDYAFCRNWRALGGEIWIVPDMNLTHHSWGRTVKVGGKTYLEDQAFEGNFHEFLLRQEGGSKWSPA